MNVALTVGITTRNRPDALRRCIASVARVLGPGAELLVYDDGSDVPAAEQMQEAAGVAVRVIRDETAPGYIAGRNALVAEARSEHVLLLDDDAVLLERGAIDRAVAVLEADPRVAAVAFAQAEPDGRPWPERMQAGRGAVPVRVASFIGFAHLIRRSTFLALGGYRAEFVCYGEEKDFCLRLLHAGHRVVYLPDARVAHVVDLGGRDQRRYVRYVIRNDCLLSLYNDPWPLVLFSVPVRLLRFGRMAASIEGGDAGGLGWVMRELRRAAGDVRRRRTPVSWRTIREWRRLGRTLVPYEGAGRG